MATLPRSRLLAVALLVVSWALPASAQDRAEQILAQARQAIGGETRLKGIRTLSVKGTIQPDGPAGRAVTNLQIDFVLPDGFLISRDWPPIFFRRAGGFNGDELIEQRQLSGKWTDVALEGGKEAAAWQLAARRRECARYLVAWLLTSPEQYGVRFTDGGNGVVADRPADVVHATGAHGFAARLFFDKATHRLAGIMYGERLPAAAPAAQPKTREEAEPVFKAIGTPESEANEVKLYFDDYRTDDGIVFPHTMLIESAGLREQWNISRFRVNPDIDVKQFRKK